MKYEKDPEHGEQKPPAHVELNVAEQLRIERRHVWYLSDAQTLVRELQEHIWPLGWHVTLGGGVLNHGYSDKDLDLYLLPRYVKDHLHDVEKLKSLLLSWWEEAEGGYDKRAPESVPAGQEAKAFAWTGRYLRGSGRQPVEIFVVRP